MKKILLLIIIAISIVTSCALFFEEPDEVDEHNFTFVNNSSYTLTITPNGQDSWLEFQIASGNSRTITIPENIIYFSYNNAGSIYCDTSGGGAVFTDL